MSGTDPIPDRESLRVTARARQRRFRWVSVGIVLAVIIVNAVMVVTTAGRDWSPVAVLVLVLPTVVLVGILVVAGRSWRRQAREPQLSYGADPRTQRAVARALREGGAADPRIEALARDAAERGRPGRWIVVLSGTVALLAAVMLVGSLIQGDRSAAVTSALVVASQALVCHTFWRLRRRAEIYLRRGP